MAKIVYWIISACVAVFGGAAIIYGPSLWAPPTNGPVASPANPASPAPAQQSQIKAESQADNLPAFDVVRVEPTGELVVAGRAMPNAIIVLMRGETQHDTASADASGHFAMAPKPLPPGAHELRLVATDKNGSRPSKQSVFVTVPDNGKGETIVALQQPSGATINLKPQPNTTAVAQGARANVRVFAVDVLTTGVVAASGTAQPGAEIRLYLNDTFIATAKAAENGAWSLTIEKGITPGLYRLRADDTAADGKVVSRAEVQFEVPNVQANVPTGVQVAAAVAAGTAANVVVPAVKTATVMRGDSLWRLSQKIYGHGMRYTVIHGANSDQIRDPNLIYPGQVFVLPAKSP